MAVDKAQCKGWVSTVDLPTAFSRIITGEYQGFVIEETYLLVADVATPWYTAPDFKVLAEMLVLRIYDGPGKFDDVPRALTALARVVGAGAIVVGTALTVTDRALQRLYARHGFTVSGTEMFKPL